VIQSRALLINPRTLELFGKYGAAETLVQNSYRLQGLNMYKSWTRIAHVEISKEKIDCKYPFLSVQEQAESERELASLLNSRNIILERGSSVSSIKNIDDDKVEVEIEKLNGEKEISRFDFVFSADGAHSIVRKSLGLNFPGSTNDGEPWSLYDLKLDTKMRPNELHVSLINQDSFLFCGRIRDDLWRVFSKKLA
jgi:2-polyprenyl-6-methoxyphenol hydroxylase-like FAD-dependent oxidoreductase